MALYKYFENLRYFYKEKKITPTAFLTTFLRLLDLNGTAWIKYLEWILIETW